MNKTQQIRDLARQVAEVAHSGGNHAKRQKWRLFNSMKWDGPPPILLSVDGFCFKEILTPDLHIARDPVYGGIETQLLKQLWYASLDSDMVIEPWVTLNATYHEDSTHWWGVQMHDSWYGDSTAFHGEMEKPEDIGKMQAPVPHLDGTTTLEQLDRVRELIDGILEVRVEWRHRYLTVANFGAWAFQLIAQARFYEWCALYPDAIRRFFQITADAFMRHNRDIERRRRLTDNRCFIPDFYAWHGETMVDDPKLSDMWVHSDAQEFQGVSPAMMDDYLMAVVRPVFEAFGHGSFGCCESLDGKWDSVKTLANLRKVTLSERTDWGEAIDNMGEDIIYSVRPSLVDTVYVEDDEQIAASLRKMADRFRGLRWELNFPGALTLNGDPQRYHRFIEIARRNTT